MSDFYRNLIPKPIRRRLYRLLFPKSPVLWANWGVLSEILAKKIPPKQPPVVILSMPRSGSSWVGEILGLSPSSLYLREPITQTHLKMVQEGAPSFFEFDTHCLPEGYASAAANAFSGLPLFSRWITLFPKQWAWLKRKQKRIVIKEINPFMLPWLIRAYQPKIIYLVRHPVATASSFERMGWTGKQFDFRLSAATLQQIPDYQQFTHSFWAEHGALQAFILKEVLKYAHDYENMRLVKYKDICADPLTSFRDLYDFAGLEWNDSVERKIRKHCHPECVDTDPYSTHRDTAREVKKWKKQVPEEKIAEAKKSWFSFNLPYYTESEW
ncbi:MAG: sulfotransferase domain-containing protein [Planctomycetota bacterium]|jgi:hypothetical protein